MMETVWMVGGGLPQREQISDVYQDNEVETFSSDDGVPRNIYL